MTICKYQHYKRCHTCIHDLINDIIMTVTLDLIMTVTLDLVMTVTLDLIKTHLSLKKDLHSQPQNQYNQSKCINRKLMWIQYEILIPQ